MSSSRGDVKPGASSEELATKGGRLAELLPELLHASPTSLTSNVRIAPFHGGGTQTAGVDVVQRKGWSSNGLGPDDYGTVCW